MVNIAGGTPQVSELAVTPNKQHECFTERVFTAVRKADLSLDTLQKRGFGKHAEPHIPVFLPGNRPMRRKVDAIC